MIDMVVGGTLYCYRAVSPATHNNNNQKMKDLIEPERRRNTDHRQSTVQ